MKRKRTSSLPHTAVYTRIGRSKIHGVGVFAIRDIPKGIRIFPHDNSRLVWIDKERLKGLPENILRLYLDFAIIDKEKGRYLCPENFGLMTVAWFLNEPCRGMKPNVRCGKNYDFFAFRNIRADEELTVDYQTFSD